ncbi:MAG: MFS transporter [Planctomycetes bacterium]|nr:MFS transporter [Planctomycetota bacterium]
MIEVVQRNPAFRRLWLSQIVSQTGDWLNRMACIVLIGRLGGDSSALGAFFGIELALRLVPPALLGPLAGPLADRISRRFLMVASDVLRALIVLGFLFVDEKGELWLLYTLVFLQMAASVFFDIARTAALPDTVSREELFDAHALSAATWSVILGVGALLSGLLVGWLGVRAAFLVDAASYVLSALFLTGLALPAPAKREPFRWTEILLFTDLRRGYAHARELGIVPILWTKTLWGGAGGFLVILSLAGSVRFGETGAEGTDAHATGALFSARGIGTWIGPILLKRVLGTSDAALHRQILIGFACAVVGYAAFGFTDDLLLSCAAVGFAHLGGSALWVASTILWQRHVEDSFRGRVFAFEYLGMCLSFAVFGQLAGLCFDATQSLAITVWCVSGLVLILGLIWAWFARGGRAASIPIASTRAPNPPELEP